MWIGCKKVGWHVERTMNKYLALVSSKYLCMLLMILLIKALH